MTLESYLAEKKALRDENLTAGDLAEIERRVRRYYADVHSWTTEQEILNAIEKKTDEVAREIKGLEDLSFWASRLLYLHVGIDISSKARYGNMRLLQYWEHVAQQIEDLDESVAQVAPVMAVTQYVLFLFRSHVIDAAESAARDDIESLVLGDTRVRIERTVGEAASDWVRAWGRGILL